MVVPNFRLYKYPFEGEFCIEIKEKNQIVNDKSTILEMFKKDFQVALMINLLTVQPP